MEYIQTNFKIIISGIKLESNFQLADTIHNRYVSNVNCTAGEDNSVVITGTICSEDKNKNFLIAEDLKEFFLRLFSLFGVNCRVKKCELDTATDFLIGQIEISPPTPLVNATKINNQVGNVISQFYDPQRSAQFFNLIESNNSIDILHRFRSLFSVFDSLSPKTRRGSINYHALKEDYVGVITDRYNGIYVTRFKEIINEFCNANLIDSRTKINYSLLLKSLIQSTDNSSLLNKDVAYNLLRCIQVIRNKVNHGDFTGLNRKIISGAYELLLPLVQKLLQT